MCGGCKNGRDGNLLKHCDVVPTLFSSFLGIPSLHVFHF